MPEYAVRFTDVDGSDVVGYPPYASPADPVGMMYAAGSRRLYQEDRDIPMDAHLVVRSGEDGEWVRVPLAGPCAGCATDFTLPPSGLVPKHPDAAGDRCKGSGKYTVSVRPVVPAAVEA